MKKEKLGNKSNHIKEQTCTICKADLKDVTFVVPLRIDSTERRENIDTLIRYTFNYFETSFIVLEADSERRYFPSIKLESYKYEFVKDKNEIFHRTKWLNRLMILSDTPIVGIWDADAIAPPDQVVESVKKIRSGEAIMSLVHDGRFYSSDKVSCSLFKKYLDIQILLKRIPVMILMHGYHSVGGAFIVNKDKYMEAGGENENFYGWGPEDTERVKRLEILGLPIYYATGTLFHLWHPIGSNSWFASKESERINRQVLQNTCKRIKI